ncbi:MAG: carbon-nitrogen hydrolase family protein [bacterium]
MKTKTGAVCLPSDVVTPERRKKQIKEYIIEASRRQIKFLVFPEYAFFQCTRQGIYAQDFKKSFHEFSEKIPNGEYFKFMAGNARKYKIMLVYGTLERINNKKHYNSIIFINDKGEFLGRHRKVILSSSEGDDGESVPGSTFRLIKTPFGKAGAVDCYEIYFPEPARVYELMGADFFVYTHADSSKKTKPIAQSRSRDSYMPLICSCYSTTSGSYILNNMGKFVSRIKGGGIAAAEIDLTKQPEGKYYWNGKESVNLRRARWFQRRPGLFEIISRNMDIQHPISEKQ